MFSIFYELEADVVLYTTDNIMDAVSEAYRCSREASTAPVGIMYEGYDPMIEKPFTVVLSYVRAPVLDEDNLPYYPELPTELN